MRVTTYVAAAAGQSLSDATEQSSRRFLPVAPRISRLLAIWTPPCRRRSIRLRPHSDSSLSTSHVTNRGQELSSGRTSLTVINQVDGEPQRSRVARRLPIRLTSAAGSSGIRSGLAKTSSLLPVLQTVSHKPNRVLPASTNQDRRRPTASCRSDVCPTTRSSPSTAASRSSSDMLVHCIMGAATKASPSKDRRGHGRKSTAKRGRRGGPR